MANSGFSLWWASPSAAQDYRPDGLRAEDAARVNMPRSPKAELEWRVSRSLIRQAAMESHKSNKAYALSHRAGHALVGVAPPDWRIGIDLELCRPRDFARLAEWCCSPAERAALADMEARPASQWFYAMWTVKEAFVKAAGLDFPADMRSVGLEPQDGGGWRLRAPCGAWQACSWGWGDASAHKEERGSSAGSQWVASAVWSASSGSVALPAWRAAAGCALPDARLLWRSSD